MAESFVAYIDESGDEGFKFNPDGSGSSRWFILSAVVVRKTNDSQIVAGAKRAREALKFDLKQQIHFCKLRHEQRVPVARVIGNLPVKTVSILIHKPSIADPEIFQQDAYSLYRYASRLLLERISWLCRDHRKKDEGDGRVQLIYSNRSAMSYEDLRAYISQLHHKPNGQTVNIDWDVIDENMVRAVNHEKMAGLQLADVVASSIYQAVNPNRYGDTETKYFEMLAKTVYQRKSKHEGYGLKFWCADSAIARKICALLPKA